MLASVNTSMLASVNRLVSWSAVVALLAVLPAASGAQEEKARQAGEDRWVPSLALTSGITIQSQEASVELLDVMDGLDEDFSTDGDDLAVSPYVGANLELMSPALPLPGRPRVFLGAEILPSFGASRDVAKIKDPSGFAPPWVPEPPLLKIPPNTPGPCGLRECYARRGYTENGILGQGSATAAEIDTLVFGAAVGVAFPFEALGRPFRLKPSFGWIRYKIDVEGRVLRAQCPTIDGPSTSCIYFTPKGPEDIQPPVARNDPEQAGFTREIVLGAKASPSFNGIGAGLEIEMDTGRVGPFGVSLFLGGRFYRTLGNRTVDLSDSAAFPSRTEVSSESVDGDVSLPADTFSANWSFEVDPWMYRAGLGLRLHWLGSQK